MMNLFSPLNEQARQDLNSLIPLIDRLFPIPGRFRQQLPRDVAELSRQLTSERPRRDAGYLGQKPLLSAYLRYFLPWNVFRLSRLLPALDLHFAEGDAITDLGSGPLTLPIALWVSRPDLRDLGLEFRCLDRTGAIMDAGKSILQALPSKWKVRTIRGSIGERIEGKPAKLVTAINVFNELFWEEHNGPRLVAERYAPVLSALAAEDGSLLIVEPGIPRSGEFISLMRSQLLLLGRPPKAPCTHAGTCPLPGGRRGAKWCHFAFETDEAPEVLHRLSEAAGLPKERATMSFLLAGQKSLGRQGLGTGPDSESGKGMLFLRVLSDPFPVGVPEGSGQAARQAFETGKVAPRHGTGLGAMQEAKQGPQRGMRGPRGMTPGGRRDEKLRSGPPVLGRYACSERGLILLRGPAERVQNLESGSFLELGRSAGGRGDTQKGGHSREMDSKSGAPVINL